MATPYVHPGGQITIIPPPEGWVSNFEDPARNPWTYAIYWTMGFVCPLTLCFVGQKLYCKMFIRRTFDLDDIFLCAGLGFVTACTVILLKGFIEKVLGVHAFELEFPGPFTQFRLALYPVAIMYPLVAMCAKLSLLISYLRLNSDRWYRWSCYFGLFFVAGSHFGLALAAAFACQPIAMAWDSTITDGHCIDLPGVYKATAIMGLLSDILLICIPIPMAAKLQMSWQQKTGLIGMFVIGGVTVLTSAMRLYYIITQLTVLDQSWGASPGAFFLVLEAHLATWCSTLTTIRLFVSNVAPRLLGSGSQSASHTGGSKQEGTGNRAHPLVTFGSAPNQKKRYNRFDDTIMLNTVVEHESNAANDVDVRGGPRSQHSDHDGSGSPEDNESEKAIMQTRTTTVTYGHSSNYPV